MYNTNIQNCNTALLEQQKTALIDEIINGHNQDFIKVFDLEAGTGKTRTAEKGIAIGVMAGHRYIFVRQFNSDGIESAKNINRISGKEVALAFNDSIFSTRSQRADAEAEFKDYPVLVITHAKYIALMGDSSKRRAFINGRDCLIIDEFINTVHRLQLSKKDIKTLEVFFTFDHELLYQYLNLVHFLDDEITNNPCGKNYARFALKSKNKPFTTFIKCVKANITSDFCKNRIKYIRENWSKDDINVELLESLSTVSQVCRQIGVIHEFYEQLCVIDNGILYSSDTRCKMWLLENNIMLDASGELQIAYTLNQKLYKLTGFDKVLNHSNWTLVNIKLNTTNAGIDRVTNYYEEVNKIVSECGNSTLVISNKSDIAYITSVPEGQKAYHYNLIGSNQWANLQNVVVAQTPNINDVEYVLKFLHYAKASIDKTPGLTTKSVGRQGKSRYSFTDPRLEHVRVLHLAETMYQGLKRVNRNMEHKTKAVVIMNNDDVLELLKMQLRGCKCKTVSGEEFEVKQTKRDFYISKLQEDSQAARFMKLIAELECGKHPELQYTDKKGIAHKKYKKADIRKYLGIDSANKFNMNVLFKTQVKTFCNVRHISTDGQYIQLSEPYTGTAVAS